MSVSTENFIKTIYLLKSDYGLKANSSNLSKQLNISKAAITDMARKLSKKGWVIYEKYKEISLTPKGNQMALSIIRRHRLWESFLVNVLNIPVAKVHNEAELLEHQTSDFMTEKLDEFLGNPKFDPHGDPIPDSSGKLPRDSNILLKDANKGKSYIISRIRHEDEETFNFLIKNNIQINKEIIIDDIFNNGSSMAIIVEDNKIVLSNDLLNNIYIKEKN